MSKFREKAAQLVEQRRAQIAQELQYLKEEYKEYAEGIVEGYQRKYGRPINEILLATTLQALDNFTREELLRESTTTSNLGSFADYGYQLISATLPNLVTNEIASLQPLKVRTGTIWYLNYKINTTGAGGGTDVGRGNIPAGANLLDAKLGIPDYIHVTSQTINLEPVATGNGTTTSFTFTLEYVPVTPNSVTIKAGSVTATDNGSGGFTGSGINTGSSSINYTTGQVTIVFTTAPTNGTAITATYKFSYEAKVDNITEVDIDLDQVTVEAEQFKLRARYSLDAAFDLQQVQGVNADDLLVATLSALIRADVDRIIMQDILDKAEANTSMGTLSFDATVPTYIPVKAHLDGFFSRVLSRGSNKIFQRTKMVGGNFIIAGTDVCTILESIDGYEGITPTGGFSGPHVAGTLRGFKVIKNPHFTTTKFVIGHKGGEYLDCGYVFAPYRALYLAPPVVLDDDRARRGLAMSAGRKMVNVDMFVAGQVTNFFV
jgi:hypothetical protein